MEIFTLVYLLGCIASAIMCVFMQRKLNEIYGDDSYDIFLILFQFILSWSGVLGSLLFIATGGLKRGS